MRAAAPGPDHDTPPSRPGHIPAPAAAARRHFRAAPPADKTPLHVRTDRLPLRPSAPSLPAVPPPAGPQTAPDSARTKTARRPRARDAHWSVHFASARSAYCRLPAHPRTHSLRSPAPAKSPPSTPARHSQRHWPAARRGSDSWRARSPPSAPPAASRATVPSSRPAQPPAAPRRHPARSSTAGTAYARATPPPPCARR